MFRFVRAHEPRRSFMMSSANGGVQRASCSRLRANESASFRAARVLALNEDAERAGRRPVPEQARGRARETGGVLAPRGTAAAGDERRAKTAVAGDVRRVPSGEQPQALRASHASTRESAHQPEKARRPGAPRARPSSAALPGTGASVARSTKNPTTRVKCPPSPAFLRAHGQLRDVEAAVPSSAQPAPSDLVGEHDRHVSPAALAARVRATTECALTRLHLEYNIKTIVHTLNHFFYFIFLTQPGQLFGIL
jgi:hypothetical protein